MWTWDSTEIDFSQTCWTFDGSNNCQTGGGKSEDISDYAAFFPYTKKKEHVVKKEIRREVEYVAESLKEEPYTPEVVDITVQRLLAHYESKAIALEMKVDQALIRKRYEEYIRGYIKKLEDDDLALILIMATI